MERYEPEKNLSVGISMAKTTRQGDPIKVCVRIEDRASGEPLVDFTVDANTWLDIVSGSHYSVAGEVGRHLERVGKELVVDSVAVPREVTTDIYDRDEEGAAITAWMNKQPWDEWEELTPYLTNNGWKVTRRRWVDEEASDD